jgi:hypothetical protein
VRISSTTGKIWWFALVCLLLGAAILFIPVREAGERQGAYTTNAGELTSDVLVGQTFQASKNDLAGIAVMFATYSGRDNTGTVEFHLRRSIDDQADVRAGSVPVTELGDNQFYRFEFEPIADSSGQTYFFYVVSPESLLISMRAIPTIPARPTSCADNKRSIRLF